MSDRAPASKEGMTMLVTTMTCCAYLVADTAALNDHTTLAPAKARYARRKPMLGGKTKLRSCLRCKSAIVTDIAVRTGHNILVSRRVSLVERPNS
jgi:hypothetical protein